MAVATAVLAVVVTPVRRRTTAMRQKGRGRHDRQERENEECAHVSSPVAPRLIRQGEPVERRRVRIGGHCGASELRRVFAAGKLSGQQRKISSVDQLPTQSGQSLDA